MRTILYSLVSSSFADGFPELADNVFGAGGLTEDSLPDSLFAVIRFGVFTRGMSHIKTGNADIWVHDRGGDYGRIDAALERIYGTLDGAEHVQEQDGSAELIQATWNSTSGDLYDPGFRTITKNSSYRLVGTGA